jgi:D-sedoheptulose 7-phosphate isomerase
MEMRELVISELEESARIKQLVAKDQADVIVKAAQRIMNTFKTGKKLLLIGNGGSAADAQHIAAELVGRFKMERAALSAIALTENTSILTALANDYSYDTVFSRQLEAVAGKGDTLLAISTSGTSKNILKAVDTAHSKGVMVIGLTGKNGSNLRDAADLTIMVPSENTPRIQEAHITIGHIICLLIEKDLFDKSNPFSR